METEETTGTVSTEEHDEAEEQPDAEPTENGDSEADSTDQDREDPVAGLKSALQKERAARKAAEKREHELRRQIEDQGKSEDEKKLDDVRREAAAEAISKANRRLVAAEFKSAAAKRVKDPRIAVRLVDLEDIEVDDDGNVDLDAINDALDELLEEYPDLAPSRFQGTADQGASQKKAKPSQLTRNDLKNMTPQAILEADRAGRLDRLKGKLK